MDSIAGFTFVVDFYRGGACGGLRRWGTPGRRLHVKLLVEMEKSAL